MAAIDPNAPKRKTLQDTIADGLGAPPDGTPGSVSPYGYMTNNVSVDGSEGTQTPAVQPTQYETGGITGGTAATPPAQTPAPQPSQVGHDGTYNGMTREQYRDAWMSSGVNSVQGMKDWLAKNGGEWLADNGTVRTPYGEVLDMGGNAKGSAAGNGVLRPAWGGGGSPGGESPSPGGGGNPFASYVPADAGGGTALGGGGVNPFVTQQNAERDSARAAILKLLEDSQKPVDPNDPNIQAQMQARDRQGQRAQERTRAMLAERAAANGDLSGGHGDGSFEASLNGLEQARGEDSADYAAGLIGQEQQARRQSLVQAIQMAEQAGQFDQSQALQRELAQMDANLKQQALQLQRYGIDTNAGLQRYGIDTNAGLEGRRLDQQQGQFDTTMDFNSAQADSDNYFRWLMAGLNG